MASDEVSGLPDFSAPLGKFSNRRSSIILSAKLIEKWSEKEEQQAEALSKAGKAPAPPGTGLEKGSRPSGKKPKLKQCSTICMSACETYVPNLDKALIYGPDQDDDTEAKPCKVSVSDMEEVLFECINEESIRREAIVDVRVVGGESGQMKVREQIQTQTHKQKKDFRSTQQKERDLEIERALRLTPLPTVLGKKRRSVTSVDALILSSTEQVTDVSETRLDTKKNHSTPRIPSSSSQASFSKLRKALQEKGFFQTPVPSANPPLPPAPPKPGMRRGSVQVIRPESSTVLEDAKKLTEMVNKIVNSSAADIKAQKEKRKMCARQISIAMQEFIPDNMKTVLDLDEEFVEDDEA